MRQGLDRLLRGIHWVENAFLVSLLLTMIILAVAQIVLRNFFDDGLLWAGPLLRILVLWIAIAGAAVASREQRHVSIDVVSRFLPAGARRFVVALTSLFAAGVCAVLAWYTLDFVKLEYEAPSMAFAQVPTWVCESIMPAGFCLISLRYFIGALKTLLHGAPPATENLT